MVFSLHRLYAVINELACVESIIPRDLVTATVTRAVAATATLAFAAIVAAAATLAFAAVVALAITAVIRWGAASIYNQNDEI